MALSELIQTHGYWVLAIGCLLEGETVLVLAGFAAHSGYLDPVLVLVIAATMGFAGDLGFFWLGRRHGPAVLARWPAIAARADRVRGWVDRRPGWAIVGCRFAYGLRVAGPVVIGTMPLSAARFAVFSAFGAALWALLIGGLGWFFGAAAQQLLGDLQRFEIGLIGLVLAAGAALWWVRRGRR